MVTKLSVNQEQAYMIGNSLNINWNEVDVHQFRRGLEVELEHGIIDEETDVTHNDMILTGKIALAHLNELPDYYSRLELIESAQFSASDSFSIDTSPSKSTLNKSLYTGLIFGAALMVLGKYIQNKKEES